MPLNLDAIGTYGEAAHRTWTSRDALLYALSVGAGTPDVTQELEFTTENSHKVTQRVLPTFGVALALGAGRVKNLGKFNPAMVVHAEQGIELHRELPVDGSITITGQLVDIVDKRSGALVLSESRAVDAETDEPIFTTTSGLFIRGEGGFSDSPGEGGSVPPHAAPPGAPLEERDPDFRVTQQTLPQQALLYRLSGDRNPLHSDPKFAGMAGFDRPILHGLCTYGFVGRALLQSLCDNDPARLTSMYGRFSKPVMPGQELTTSIWVDEDEAGASFKATTSDDTVVLDRGRCTFA